MANLQDIFTATVPTYQKPEDLDFPVSKLRLFMDVLWQYVTGKQLDEAKRTQLKQLIDLLNLLDEHKHESPKELIAAMLPSINPLLEAMPTLGYTGMVTFTHLVPMYQQYLPHMEKLVRDAHPFTQDDTLLYYDVTIFDHLFLVHLFEQEDLNLIEVVATIKAIILINALTYDYHQHTAGRSISFFTFLQRGGISAEQLHPFYKEVIERIKQDTRALVGNEKCLEVLEFLSTQLMNTTAQPTAVSAPTPVEIPIQTPSAISSVQETVLTPTPSVPAAGATPAVQAAPVEAAPAQPPVEHTIGQQPATPVAPQT